MDGPVVYLNASGSLNLVLMIESSDAGVDVTQKPPSNEADVKAVG